MAASSKPQALSAARKAAEICLDLKAEDVVILDLSKASTLTDCFVIASGTSDAHVRSIGERLIESMRKEGQRPHHIEGLQQGRWALIDYTDFVVHIFHPSLRNFYQLERLWGDAEVIQVQPETLR